jgi:hypothetical protein
MPVENLLGHIQFNDDLFGGFWEMAQVGLHLKHGVSSNNASFGQKKTIQHGLDESYIEVQLNEISLYALNLFFGCVESTGGKHGFRERLKVVSDGETPPAYTVELTEEPFTSGTKGHLVVVAIIDGIITPLTKVTSLTSPAIETEYTLTGSVIEVNATLVGKWLRIYYVYQSLTDGISLYINPDYIPPPISGCFTTRFRPSTAKQWRPCTIEFEIGIPEIDFQMLVKALDTNENYTINLHFNSESDVSINWDSDSV